MAKQTRTRPAARTFHQLAAAYSADVRRLASAARTYVRKQLPDTQETVDSSGPYVSYGYGSGYKGMVCSLILSKGGVKLGIVGGAGLADPHRLLEGAGKSHRHIVLKTPTDLDRPGIEQLVQGALRLCRQRIAGGR